jgi:uncharacterized protein (DUF885 family)
MSAMETPRAIADAHVDEVVRLDPFTATLLGVPEGRDRLPDLSPAGIEANAGAMRTTLARLDRVEASGRPLPEEERRCAVLLRERLEAALDLHDAGEPFRHLGQLESPLVMTRAVFTLMPTETPEDWAAVGTRLRAVPAALLGYRETLEEGLRRDLPAGPAQVAPVLAQLDGWLGSGPGTDWFSSFAQGGPADQQSDLAGAAAVAAVAFGQFREWLAHDYGPVCSSIGVDQVGPERYGRFARNWTGSRLDLQEAYDWGWAEFGRIDAELREQAELVRPGEGPLAAMAWLRDHGPAVEGVDQVRAVLQQMMDDAIAAVDGVHFDLPGPVRRVEAMIAPAGSAAAPYYTQPAVDFSRPGRTWLPTQGGTRFPTWDLVSTWYHEGVPGHHLQLATWVYCAPQLSRYQTSIGAVDAMVEGWALYAERLMDELGYFSEPATRIGYLDSQQARAVRVLVDIGMHLSLELPADQGGAEPFAVGQRWSPALAREFFGLHSGRPAQFLDDEIVRYLEIPGQAIGYKVGERAWLAGRAAARAAQGAAFDLKAWHNAALAAGSLGLDDLVRELAALPVSPAQGG